MGGEQLVLVAYIQRERGKIECAFFLYFIKRLC
jgi:hypothetical protein